MVKPKKRFEVRRFEIWLVSLNPTKGYEVQKTRPCLIISPDEMNKHLKTVIIAPMTTVVRKYPSRVDIEFDKKQGQVALDQLRCVDKERLIKKLGSAAEITAETTCAVLAEIFAL